MDPLSSTFAALADPTRRAILARLADGATPVGELCKAFPISGPAVSRHLRVLQDAHLIEREVDKQWRICRLQPAGLVPAHHWLSRYRAFWEEGLDRLASLLEEPSEVTPPLSTPRPARKRKARGVPPLPFPEERTNPHERPRDFCTADFTLHQGPAR